MKLLPYVNCSCWDMANNLALLSPFSVGEAMEHLGPICYMSWCVKDLTVAVWISWLGLGLLRVLWAQQTEPGMATEWGFSPFTPMSCWPWEASSRPYLAEMPQLQHAEWDPLAGEDPLQTRLYGYVQELERTAWCAVQTALPFCDWWMTGSSRLGWATQLQHILLWGEKILFFKQTVSRQG